MSTGRDSLGVAALDGFLYAVGGTDGRHRYNLVERYDVRRNEWIRMTPMNTLRSGLAVSVLNGCLYAVGGGDGSSILDTVERFDPRVEMMRAT
ncbi:kelch repeat protein, partial [Ostertagia ostertagi]